MSPISRAGYGSLLLLVLTVASFTKVSGEGYSLLSWLAGAFGPENHEGSAHQAVAEPYVIQEWEADDEDEDVVVDFQPVEEKPRHRRVKKAPSPAAKKPKKSPNAPGGKGAKAPSAPGLKKPKAPGKGKAPGTKRRRH